MCQRRRIHLACTRLAGPYSRFRESDALHSCSAVNHASDTTVADRQCLEPSLGRLGIPQLVLRLTRRRRHALQQLRQSDPSQPALKEVSPAYHEFAPLLRCPAQVGPSEGFIRVEHSKGGMSYRSARNPRIQVRMGKHTKIESLEITWPSGQVNRLTDVPIDRIIAIKKKGLELSRASFRRRQAAKI